MTAVDYYVLINGSSVSANTLEGGSITFGRQRPQDLCVSAFASFRLLNDASSYSIGDEVYINCNDGTTRPRFNGRITMISRDRNVTTISAVSRGLGLLARYWVPAFTMPASFDGEAINSIRDACLYACYKAGVLTADELALRLGAYSAVPLTASTYLNLDAGPPTTSGADLGNTSLLATLQTITNWDPMPFLNENVNGDVYYKTYTYRSGPPADWTVDKDTVLNRHTASQSQDGLTNYVTVNYSTSSSVTRANLYSVATYGRYAQGYATSLRDESDARAKLEVTLYAYAQPRWYSNPITIFVNDLTAGQTADLYTAYLGQLINTNQLSTDIPGIAQYSYIEGWQEQFGRNQATVALYLSDWRQTQAPEQWNQVSGALQWNSGSISTYTWRDLIGVSI